MFYLLIYSATFSITDSKGLLMTLKTLTGRFTARHEVFITFFKIGYTVDTFHRLGSITSLERG